MTKIQGAINIAMLCALAGCGDNLPADAATAATAEPTIALPGLSAPAVARYDAQGVPHIRCAVRRDCFAVQGYAQARDRMLAMDVLRHTARATLSELVGERALSQDGQLRTLFLTRAGHRVEIDLAAALDPITRSELVAFADGVNAYLAEIRSRPGKLPPGYAALPFVIASGDIHDWTIEDTLAISRLSQFQLSESFFDELDFAKFVATYGPGSPLSDPGKIAAWIRAAAPETERAHTLSSVAASSPSDQSGALQRRSRFRPMPSLAPWRDPIERLASISAELAETIRPLDSSFGSNNWAVAAAKSTTDSAMIANDPHLALQAPPLFHLVTMTADQSEDATDFSGGSFPGVPGILLGRGPHVGWGVTVTGFDVTDIYLEQFLPQAACPGGASGPPCVKFRGRAVSTIVVPQKFLVRTADGLVDARALESVKPPPSISIVVPHHGPIVSAPDAAGKALSLRWTGHEGTTQDFRALLDLARAPNVEGAIEALRGFSVGAQNFVMADDQGRIAYSAHALVPVRKFSEGPGARPPWLPLPGDGTAEWGDGISDCATSPVPSSCWVADELLPQSLDPSIGYLFTANANPSNTSDDNDPLAHPPYLSFAWGDSSGFRATRVQERIEEVLAAHGKVSPADMASIQSDHVSRLGRAMHPHLLRASAGDNDPEITIGRALIEKWAAGGWRCPSGIVGTDPIQSPPDPRGPEQDDAVGCLLFHAIIRELYVNVFADDLAIVGQTVNSMSASKAMLLMLGLPADAPETSLCHDVDPFGRVIRQSTCVEQVRIAIKSAVEGLISKFGPKTSDWLWGRTHVARVAPVVVGTLPATSPIARPGGLFTVDVGNPSPIGSNGDFSFTAGSNLRHISIMGQDPSMRLQLPGVQRDGSGLGIGPNLLDQWARNVYFELPLGSKIEKATTYVQRFK